MLFETGDDQYGFYESECLGCDTFTRTDDIGLCEDCAGKLDRDFIRQRDWDYSATAFTVSSEFREELRSAIIHEYGKALELISTSIPKRSRSKGRKGNGKRKKHGKNR